MSQPGFTRVPDFYVVLLHTPVVNRHGLIVTTAVTNMDIHDLSRSARTFGAKGYFLVTPIEDQHVMVGRILDHWRGERQREYHPDRVEAVSLVRLASSFEEVKAAIRAECGGQDPEVVMPDARPLPNSISYADYRRELADPNRPNRPVAIVLGTGWGISDVFFPEVHRILAPVYGPGGNREVDPNGRKTYNHLSVRAAGAIILDRLFGQ